MTSKTFGNIIQKIGRWWHQDAVQPINPVQEKEIETKTEKKEDQEATNLNTIDIKMKDEHVSIDMDHANYNHTEQNKGFDLDYHEKYRSERSLKQYYLGCSCSVCYQRYHISKGYHCCDSKSRCNVRRYEKSDDLEDSIDSHSAPIERKCETMKEIPEEIVKKVDEVALGKAAYEQQNDLEKNENAALVDDEWLKNENSEIKKRRGRTILKDIDEDALLDRNLNGANFYYGPKNINGSDAFTNILELPGQEKDRVAIPAQDKEVVSRCDLRRYSFSKRSDKYIKALSNNRKEREKMAGEKMKKIRDAFRKLREKDTFKTSTKIDASGWIPPSEENDNLSSRGLLPCGNSALMQFLSEAFLIFLGTLVIAGIVVRLFYGNGLITI